MPPCPLQRVSLLRNSLGPAVQSARREEGTAHKRVPRIRRPQEEIFVIATALNGEIKVRKNPWRSALANDI